MKQISVPRWAWYTWPLIPVLIVLFITFSGGEKVASAAGQKLYERHCQTCHMVDGKGLGKLIPPLAAADYVLEGGAELACLIRKGAEGEMVVNGVTYDRPMPGFPNLLPVEIRSILLYIRSAWGNQAPDLSFDDIEAALSQCP